MAKKKRGPYKAASDKEDAPISTTVKKTEKAHWMKLARQRGRPHTKMVADAMREYVEKYPLLS